MHLSPGMGLTVSWAAVQSRQQCGSRSGRHVPHSAYAGYAYCQVCPTKQHFGSNMPGVRPAPERR